jgi:murein DD-endopeptidase MepM/ murein hydrolase activator NlpD
MFNRFLTFLFSFAFCNIVLSQSIFNIPIEGIYGRDYIVVNYVDWATGQLILDHNCGSKTYDGHQGTDFTLRSFAAMDSGVNVIAAADGIVTYVKDGLFDREMESDISKGFGNYVALSHKNGYQTYYAHLKKIKLK